MILAVVATSAEAAAVRRGADPSAVRVVVSGVGAARAAAGTAAAMARGDWAAVLSLGIAGGFPARAAPGDVVVADQVIAADLGVEEADGCFRPLDELGLGATRLSAQTGAVPALRAAGLTVRVGPVLTVSTVTGTDARAAELTARYDAAAEAMEGFGVAVAAGTLPFAEVRAVTNAVGQRDRAAWQLRGALDVLSRASAIVLGKAAS